MSRIANAVWVGGGDALLVVEWSYRTPNPDRNFFADSDIEDSKVSGYLIPDSEIGEDGDIELETWHGSELISSRSPVFSYEDTSVGARGDIQYQAISLIRHDGHYSLFVPNDRAPYRVEFSPSEADVTTDITVMEANEQKLAEPSFDDLEEAPQDIAGAASPRALLPDLDGESAGVVWTTAMSAGGAGSFIFIHMLSVHDAQTGAMRYALRLSSSDEADYPWSEDISRGPAGYSLFFLDAADSDQQVEPVVDGRVPSGMFIGDFRLSADGASDFRGRGYWAPVSPKLADLDEEALSLARRVQRFEIENLPDVKAEDSGYSYLSHPATGRICPQGRQIEYESDDANSGEGRIRIRGGASER